MTSEIGNVDVKSKMHPWYRFMARAVDLNLFTVFFIGFFTKTDSIIITIVIGMIMLVLWVPVEAFLMSTWGYTPGKWLFKITVRTDSDQNLEFNAALKRSFGVWRFGLAMGLPVYNLFTFYEAYSDLKKNGMTVWDKKGRFRVSHKDVSFIRKFLAMSLLLISSSLMIPDFNSHVIIAEQGNQHIVSSFKEDIGSRDNSYIQYLNRDLPKMTMKGLSLNRIFISNNSLVFLAQYVDKTMSEIPKNDILNLKYNAVHVCKNTDTKKLLSSFSGFIYSYVDKNNQPVADVVVTLKDCDKSTVQLYNEQLPMIFDSVSQLNKLYEYDHFLIYDFKLISVAKDQINVSELKQSLEKQLLLETCQNTNYFEMIPEQKGIIHRYTDKNDIEIMSVSVIPQQCSPRAK